MFSVDTKLTGIRAVFKEYESESLNVLDEAGKNFIGTKEIMDKANAKLESKGLPTLSRASYINYIKDLSDQGFIDSKYATGKGGRRDNYRLLDGGLKSLYREITIKVIKSLIEAFPELDFTEIIQSLV